LDPVPGATARFVGGGRYGRRREVRIRLALRRCAGGCRSRDNRRGSRMGRLLRLGRHLGDRRLGGADRRGHADRADPARHDVTPVPRRRPWELASQTASLDNLSGGRVILPVGLGVADEDRWWLFEDDPGRRVRAELLDEGLAMMEHRWRGRPFTFDGRHYHTLRQSEVLQPPPAVQQPRIPVWVVGAWPRMRSMRRAARWDGWLPAYMPPDSAGHAEPTPGA